MKKLFLTSSFNDVAMLFMDFMRSMEEDVAGKTVTFIPTASLVEEVKFYVASARKAFKKMGVIVDELELTKATTSEIENKLRRNDYIYISGGNTFFLLQELKRTGADKIIIEQIASGKWYIGESAGSMIVAPDISYVQEVDDYKIAPDLDSFLALNVIDFYPVPHHTNPPFTEAIEAVITEYGSELNLCPISNSQAILILGDKVRVEENA